MNEQIQPPKGAADLVQTQVRHSLRSKQQIVPMLGDPVASDREFARKIDKSSSKKLASMLCREYICIEIGDPLLPLLRGS
jgi:hypothetical protein